MKTKPNEIWQEYQRLCEYLTKNNVYETVKQNENFYIGKQWIGLEGDDNLPKPVVNEIQRCVKHLVSAISSNDVAISMVPVSSVGEDVDKMAFISKAVENVIEQAKMKEASKLAIRNCAVDGSSYMLQTFEPDYETGEEVTGRIENVIVDNTNVHFGNPYSNIVQKQPYIIISLRQHLQTVREEAKELGLSEEEIEQIAPDNENTLANDDSTELVTVLLKFYKEISEIEEEKQETDQFTGTVRTRKFKKKVKTVWFTKTTKNVALIEPTNLGYKRYPIACFGWEVVKNSYLYTSPITQQITNQIFLNKSLAIAEMYGLQSAFPKIVYDKNKVNIDELLNSTSPNAVTSLDMAGKFLDFIQVPDFSNNILNLVSQIISYMKDTMGVTDTDLGNVNPENTSAIVALQEASSTSLEMQRQLFYEFWEDIVRNVIDIMSCTYGVRRIMNDNNEMAIVDFSVLRDLNYNLTVDIGAGAQYSEIAQVNTLDKLLQSGIVTPEMYVQLMPGKYILGKSKIVSDIRAQQEAQMAQMQQLQGMADQLNLPKEMDESAPL